MVPLLISVTPMVDPKSKNHPRQIKNVLLYRFNTFETKSDR